MALTFIRFVVSSLFICHLIRQGINIIGVTILQSIECLMQLMYVSDCRRTE